MAEKIWSEETHKEATYENYTKLHRDHPELAAFEQPDEKAVN